MRKYRIKIELLSDLCVSDGGKYNSSVDTDICHDEHGFPYIPAKRLKGCLRECAVELNDWGDTIDIDAMFGSAGNCCSGGIVIRDAELEGRRECADSIEKNEGCPVFHPQNVLNAFSYLRYQTAIDYETGVAKEKSLRSMRVADKGLIFYADAEPGCHKAELERCLTVFRRMGIARTRGFGEIRACLECYEEKAETEKHHAYVAGSTELQYRIFLKKPVVCKSVNGQEENSMDYVEGAKIIGLLGQAMSSNREAFLELLNSKTLKFSNAYVSDGKERYTEIPAAFLSIKNQKEDYRNRIYETESELKEDVDVQSMQAKHCYVSTLKKGAFRRLDVEMEERYHHSRGKDKSIGRATGEDDSKFYQMSSINKGQNFEGFITGTETEIRNIYEKLSPFGEISIGYGRNGEYGLCDFQIVGFDRKKTEKQKGRTFFVKLEAPTIIYGKNAVYTTNAADLIAEIAAVLGVSASRFVKVRKFLRTVSVGGFNVTWGCRKPTIEAFDKGTVLCIECEEDISLPVGRIFLGERTKEGYGEASVSAKEESGAYKINLVSKTEPDQSSWVDIAKYPLFGKVVERMYREYLRSLAVSAVRQLKNEKAEKKNTKDIWKDEWRPVVSNMLLMSKEAESFEAMKKFATARYQKTSDKKKGKGAIANEIFGMAASNNFSMLAADFCEENRITEFQYSEKADLEYLIDLLIEIKYAVRTGKEAKDE